LGFWPVTNLKNKKLLLSNIWIPNMINYKNEINQTRIQENKNNIKQGMVDIGINSRYGPYSLKPAVINKLFNLGLNQAQVNKIARCTLNFTMGLYYNPTSSHYHF
jgi:hypothetical protein